MVPDGDPPPFADAGSVTLLERARTGDAEAINELLARYLPRMRRWAHGRVPAAVRDSADTEDLVQDTVLSFLRQLDRFEHRREGALQAYLRQALLNRIRSRFRSAGRQPEVSHLSASHPDHLASPLEQAIGSETLDRYELALQQLSDEDRELVIAKVEMGCSNEELTLLFGKPTKDAARVAATRAVLKLAALMDHE